MLVLVKTKVRQLLLKFKNRPFKIYDFSNGRAPDEKPVSLIWRILWWSLGDLS
jgi:hypothetical protein